jgi:hypothetical protein
MPGRPAAHAPTAATRGALARGRLVRNADVAVLATCNPANRVAFEALARPPSESASRRDLDTEVLPYRWVPVLRVTVPARPSTRQGRSV